MYEKYYKILEVDKNVSQEELKTAFRRKAIQFHPDKNKSKDAQENFILIKEAYDTIQMLLTAQQKNHRNNFSHTESKTRSESYNIYQKKNKTAYCKNNRIYKNDMSSKILAILILPLGLALVFSPLINYRDLHTQTSKYIGSAIVGLIIGVIMLLFSFFSLKSKISYPPQDK